MLIIAIGWMFVVVVFALAQASAPGGTLLGALLTLVLGLAPLAVVIYLALAASRRRRARQASASDPDRSGHATGDPVAAKREEA
jgi:membrane protein implicated in regulation of membrane protease activity